MKGFLKTLGPILGLLAMLLLSAPAEAKHAAYVELRVKPNPAGIGDDVIIECRLWSKGAADTTQRVRGGLIQISVFDLDRKKLASQFVDKPNGRYDIFEFPWKAARTGQYKVECSYTGSAFLTAARTSKKLKVNRTRSGGLVSRPLTKPTTTEVYVPTTRKPAPSTTLAQPPTTLTPVKPTVTQVIPRTTAPSKLPRAKDNKILTKVDLSAKRGPKPGHYLVSVRVSVTTDQAVEEGEVLITVSGGMLQPGHKGQTLISAAAGRQTLTWVIPPGSKKSYLFEAAYFGGFGPQGEYRPATGSIRLPK